jgi:Uma2 family endonuclease
MWQDYAMVVPRAARFTVAEYLALEAVAERKHEYIGGDIVAMAGAEPEHNLIAGTILGALTSALADRPCRVFPSDQRVLVEAVGEYFYPDVVVTCLEPIYVEPKPRSLANPQVIVEVLSESTERKDRGEKWLAYQALPTLTDYVMVASTQRRIEHYHRSPDGSWTLRVLQDQGTCTVAGVTLDLHALYRLI